MNTGENEQGLRSIIDFLRKGSVVVLILHFFISSVMQLSSFGD